MLHMNKHMSTGEKCCKESLGVAGDDNTTPKISTHAQKKAKFLGLILTEIE